MSEHQSVSKSQEAKKVTSESVSKETQTSFEDAAYDFSPEVMALKSLQTAADNSPRSNSITQLQAMADARATSLTGPIQRQENNTGLPDNLKSGMENLSGLSMDDVKVHRNSDKPAQLQAHAYAQGTDIYLGPGQEKHLPHELGHVVQQKQGRVKPTIQKKGKININDNIDLEKEADVMGAKALQMKGNNEKLSNDSNYKIESHLYSKTHSNPISLENGNTLQLYVIQREKEDPGVESEKKFYETGAQSSSNAFPEINFGKNGEVATLHIHVDLDAPDASLRDQIQSGEVGHTWIALEWFDPKNVPDNIPEPHKRYLEGGGKTADPMGFWPKMWKDVTEWMDRDEAEELNKEDREGYSANPLSNYVGGHMLHPDRQHDPKATYSFDITRNQFDSVINYAESKKGNNYSLFYFNCTTFAKGAAKAAGQSPPSLGVGTICYPDAIYSSIKKKLQKNDKNAEIIGNSMQSDLDTDVQFADADKLLGGQWIQNTEWSFIMNMSDSIGDEILYYNKDNSEFFFLNEIYDLDIFFIKGAEYEPNYISKEELNTYLSEREIESISEEFSSQAGPIINDEPNLTESSPDETPSWEKAGEDVYCWPREVNGRWWYYYQNPEGDFYKYIQGDFTSEELNQEQFNDLFYS
ncbi:DUF4157 domain-containing protein [Flavobacteriaceae bacterium]|nr:DUF4157 domain-containing protein [Flavobacteriaceae bacterium]